MALTTGIGVSGLYHTLVPGINSILSETLWAPFMFRSTTDPTAVVTVPRMDILCLGKQYYN